MKKYMERRKSLFESLPDNIEPRLPDIEPRPLNLEEIKRKAYPRIP